MHEFHFIRPLFLLLLIPLALILSQLLFSKHSNNSSWRNACDAHLLPHLLRRVNSVNNQLPLLLLAAGWLIAVIALAGPTWQRLPQPVYRSLAATVIALDLSDAMYAGDIAPNRLTRAKFKVDDILKQIKDGQIGMIAFSSEPYVVSPLTEDAATIVAMVPVLSPAIMPVNGNNIGRALQKSADLIKQADIRDGQIILITANKPTAADNKMASELAKQGFKLSVLGIGTTQGAPISVSGGFMQDAQGNIVLSQLDPKALQQLAREGDGQYVAFTNNNQDVTTLLTHDSNALQLKAEESTAKTDQWKDHVP